MKHAAVLAILLLSAAGAGAQEVQTVGIDIKPGSTDNPINTKSRGKIPVAILSSATFDAPAVVDRATLTFGRTGDEDSFSHCGGSGEDVNADGLADLVCHFNTQDAAFALGDTLGILKGATLDGVAFQGTDTVFILH
jgi:hypothetical protein